MLETVQQSTQLEIAYKGLAAREKRLRSIFDSAPCAIVHMTRDGRILEANTTAQRFGGLNPRQILGRCFVELFLHRHMPFRRDIEKMLSERAHESFIRTQPTADGESRVLDWRLQRMPDDTADGMNWVAAGYDISRQQQAEQALRDSEEKMGKAFKVNPNFHGICPECIHKLYPEIDLPEEMPK